MEETGLNDSLQQRGWASRSEASAGPSNASHDAPETFLANPTKFSRSPLLPVYFVYFIHCASFTQAVTQSPIQYKLTSPATNLPIPLSSGPHHPGARRKSVLCDAHPCTLPPPHFCFFLPLAYNNNGTSLAAPLLSAGICFSIRCGSGPRSTRSCVATAGKRHEPWAASGSSPHDGFAAFDERGGVGRLLGARRDI